MAVHDALMDRCGWPAIPFDGQLLMSQQDALLVGGKVQAPPGYADHVTFLYPDFCERCATKLCIEMCSGQALTPGPRGVPLFDREKCVFCGACLWNCQQPFDDDPVRTNVAFRARGRPALDRELTLPPSGRPPSGPSPSSSNAALPSFPAAATGQIEIPAASAM